MVLFNDIKLYEYTDINVCVCNQNYSYNCMYIHRDNCTFTKYK